MHEENVGPKHRSLIRNPGSKVSTNTELILRHEIAFSALKLCSISRGGEEGVICDEI